jgi:hypothetical protein
MVVLTVGTSDSQAVVFSAPSTGRAVDDVSMTLPARFLKTAFRIHHGGHDGKMHASVPSEHGTVSL